MTASRSISGFFPGGSEVKALKETWVPSLGWEDPLEKEIATHSSILDWKISWTERGAWQAKKKKIPAFVHLIKPVNPKGNQP